MNPVDYALLTTDDLIQRFIDQADHIGTVVPLQVKVPLTGDEFKRGAHVLHAIADQLRARKPIAEIRARLFQNESVSVRAWSGTLLHSVDPEWAGASSRGVYHGLTTLEVLAWRRRILQRPRQKPDLQKMSTTQLVESFVDACERCYGTTRFLTDEESGGVKMTAYNKVMGEVHTIARELHRRSELQALVPLFDHPIITVREEAAGYCLPVATEQAIATLEAVEATKVDPEFMAASFTLDRWRDGTYGPFKIFPRPTQT
jgi:Domain of unknown function (DUF2019)